MNWGCEIVSFCTLGCWEKLGKEKEMNFGFLRFAFCFHNSINKRIKRISIQFVMLFFFFLFHLILYPHFFLIDGFQ